jgi:hypothetical protein
MPGPADGGGHGALHIGLMVVMPPLSRLSFPRCARTRSFNHGSGFSRTDLYRNDNAFRGLVLHGSADLSVHDEHQNAPWCRIRFMGHTRPQLPHKGLCDTGICSAFRATALPAIAGCRDVFTLKTERTRSIASLPCSGSPQSPVTPAISLDQLQREVGRRLNGRTVASSRMPERHDFDSLGCAHEVVVEVILNAWKENTPHILPTRHR